MTKIQRHGAIKCTAANDYGSVVVNIELAKIDLAIIEPSYRNIKAIPGKILIIPCRAAGVPKPNISWLLPQFRQRLQRCVKFSLLGYKIN